MEWANVPCRIIRYSSWHRRDENREHHLLLRLARLGAAPWGGVTLGHVAGQATNVVLEEFVLIFQLVMIRFHCVDAFRQSLQ